MPCAVILTALPVEYLAVRVHLTNLREETHPKETIYERGTFTANGQTWDVGIVEIGAGNPGAALEAERAIAYFSPDVIFFVGVAGGIKDVVLGDVVASTKVYGYESGKAGETFRPRPEVGLSAYGLEQRARAEARKSDWLQRLPSTPSPAPKVYVAPIAAGEKVVASVESEVFKFLRLNYGDAVAVEMEGFGFLDATRANQQVSALVIRGISDLVYNKTQADEEGYQEIAARHASAFTFEVLAKFQVNRKDSTTGNTRDSIQIDSTETIQSKRAQLRKNENELRLLREQVFTDDANLPKSHQEEIQSKERLVALLHQASREDLRRLSPLPLQRYGRFIGRGQNVDSIIATLNNFETYPIVAIDGIGGVGKTALAREVAQRSLEAGTFAAVVWESAKPEEFTGTEAQPQFTADIDFDNLLDLIGRKLGYFEVASQKNTSDKRKLVFRILNESAERYLVVVDNLETVKGYRDLVNNLNGMFIRSKAILTTRKKVTEFRHVYSISLRGLASNESVEFLRSEASKRGEAGDIIRFAEERKLVQVHEATGGLPLAMELVVGQATRSSLERVLHRLQSVNFQAVKDPDSAESVYGNFFKFIYWDSWNQLSDGARELLISLGTFDLVEGSDLDELANVSRLQAEELDSASGELVEYSLIHRTPKDGQMTFFLHPLTHRFVQDDLVRS